MPAAAVLWRASIRIGGAYRDDVLVDVIAMHVVQVPVMQVVDMAAMPDGRVAAIGAVLVGVAGVLGIAAAGHRVVSLMLAAAWTGGGVRSMA